MLIPKEFHPWIYNNFLHDLYDESVMRCPLFLLPFEHYLIHFALLSLVHLGPPTILRKIFWLPLFILHLFYSPLSNLPIDSDPLTNLLNSMVTLQTLNMTITLLLSYPEETDYRIKYLHHEKGIHDPARFQPYTYAKLKWAFERCFVNMRGVGWSFQMPHVITRPNNGVNKWSFIIFKCIIYEIIFKFFIFYDFGLFIYRLSQVTNPYNLSNILVQYLYFSITKYSFIHLLISAMAATSIIYFGLNAAYWQIASISLSCGFSNVEDWPDMFQLGSNGFSMQTFWSIWWHQYITRDAYIISKWITNIIGLKSKSFIRRYLIVSFTFLICGYLHAVPSLSLNWGPDEYNHLVPDWVPHKIVLPWFSTAIHINRCYYSFFLFIYSANVLIFENVLKESVFAKLSILKNPKFNFFYSILAAFSMLAIQAWPIIMYIKELDAAGMKFAMYHKISLVSMIY